MSTDLDPVITLRPSDKIEVNQFGGGIDREGRCLQLTQMIDGEWRYIQLTRKDAWELAKRLIAWVQSTSDLHWHYGPTDADPDGGKKWCYECRGEIGWRKDGEGEGAATCHRCGRWKKEEPAK